MNRKICLVIPYFGKFPNYFKLWLISAQKNDGFDFLIFTDNESYQDSKNIKFIKMSFNKFRQLLQNKVEFPICLSDPYKICDYRPMFGTALHKYLKKYEFWGFCDVDLIFGNLSKFITPKLLNNYDKIYQLGHLTLLRNNTRCNNLWKIKHHLHNAYRYDEAFKTPYPCHFDETDGLTKISEMVGIKIYKSVDFADIDWTRYNFHLLGIQGANTYVKGLFIWNNGSLMYKYLENNQIKTLELAYAHFQKRNMEFNIPNIKDVDLFTAIPNKFLLDSNVKKLLQQQCLNQKYQYYQTRRKKEFIKKLKHHAIQQRFYRTMFKNMNRKVLDKKSK